MSNVSSSNGIEKYPKLRFKEFSKPWSHVRLADFSERVVRKNKNNETELPLTISSRDGLVDQITFFNKTVASKDMSGYYLLKKGEYAYNKSYSAGYDFGSIKRLERYPMGALSTLYICFALTKYDSDYIKTYFDSLKWYKEIYMISAEGARNHGLLNVPTDEFFETYHYITEDVNEQEKIASLMNLIEQRIQKQQTLVDTLKKYKRGLIQSVFSDISSWMEHSIYDIGTVVTGNTPPTNNPENYIGDRLFCAPGDLGHSKYITTTEKNISENALNKNRKIPKGSILVTCIGSTIGKMGIANEEMLTNQQINSVIVSAEHCDEFVYYALEYNFPQFLSHVGKQAVPILSKGQFENLCISLPSIEEQRKCSAMLASLDIKIEKATELLLCMQKYKCGLLQQLFI